MKQRDRMIRQVKATRISIGLLLCMIPNGAHGQMSAPLPTTPAEVERQVLEALRASDAAALTRLSALIARSAEAGSGLAGKVMGSDHPKVREFTATALAASATDIGVRQLIGGVRRESDVSVRSNMIEALRSIRAPAAIPPLAQCAQDMSDLSLHRECRDTMSDMESPEAASRLIAIIETGGIDNVEPLAYALAHFKHESGIAVLRLAAASANPNVMRASMAALGYIGTPQSLGALFDLIASGGNEDRSEYGRRTAVRNAAERPGESLIPVYERALEKQGDIWTADAAIDCLLLNPSPSAYSALERQFGKARDPRLRTRLEGAMRAHKMRRSPAEVQ
jgi:HEAT repeat protein